MTLRHALVMLAACGGSSDRPDALPRDAVESSGSVTVIVTERGKPVSGLPVFFHRDTDTLAFEAVTSIDGSSGYNLDGTSGFVTVLLPKTRYGIDRLSTFSNVQMGEVLHLDLEPPGPQTIELDVSVSGTGPIVLYTTCGGEEPFGLASGVATKVSLECTGAKVDLLAVQLDPDTNEPIASVYQPDVDVAARTVALTGPFMPIANMTVTYNSDPHGYTFIHTTQSVLGPNGRLFDSFVGAELTSPDPFLLQRPSAAGASFVLATSGFPLANDFDEQVRYTVDTTAGVALAVDMSSRLPQYLNTELDVTKPPVVGEIDAANHKLVWRDAGNGNVQANMVRARVRFFRDDIPQGTSWTWQIVAPRRPANEIVFPTLPTLPFDLNPQATDIDSTEELTSIKLPGTDADAYKAARPNGFADLSTFAQPSKTEALIVQRRFIHEPTQ